MRSSPIRKGTMQQEEIKAVAQELTRWPEIIKEVQASNKQVVKWDYKAFASSIKAKLQKNNDTVTIDRDSMKSLFPQIRVPWEVAKNLKNNHWLSYRIEWKNYIFFIEPTREQLIVQLTSAETKVIELKEEKIELSIQNYELSEENSKLKSDLLFSKKITLAFVILSIISILL